MRSRIFFLKADLLMALRDFTRDFCNCLRETGPLSRTNSLTSDTEVDDSLFAFLAGCGSSALDGADVILVGVICLELLFTSDG